VLFTIFEEDIFLRVIEVGLNTDTGVGFNDRALERSQMDSVIFGASLKNDACGVKRGMFEGGEEVAEQGGCLYAKSEISSIIGRDRPAFVLL
jgi:hypothetical protein